MSEAYFYFQRATSHHFPDRMNTPAKTANDNYYEKGLADMAGHQPPEEPKPANPFEALAKAMDYNAKAITSLTECLQAHHQVLDDHENRIQALEGIVNP